MTKEKLGQLMSLRMEISSLERKITELEQKRTPQVKDSVKSSRKDWPYTQSHTVIEGIDYASDQRKSHDIERLKVTLKNRRIRAIETETEIEKYIDSIDDSRMRLMIQYRYVDGYTYEKVGELMHCDRTTVERSINRYLSNN